MDVMREIMLATYSSAVILLMYLLLDSGIKGKDE